MKLPGFLSSTEKLRSPFHSYVGACKALAGSKNVLIQKGVQTHKKRSPKGLNAKTTFMERMSMGWIEGLVRPNACPVRTFV